MRKLYIIGLIGVAVLIVAIAYAEQITLSTYYPAPYGVYREMRATRMAVGDSYIDGAANSWGGTIDSDADLVVEDKVGIGTTAPLGKLHIKNTTAYDGATANFAADSIALYGSVPNRDGDYFGGITWHNDSRRRAGIASVMERADSDYTGLAFFTQGTDGPGPMRESMRITHAGNVGIGTSNPGQKLEVRGSVELEVDDADSKLRFHDPGNDWYSMGIDRSDGGKFKINRGGAIGDNDGFTLTRAGNVGIGTSGPTATLHVGGISGTDGIKFPDGTLQTTAAGMVQQVNTQTTAWRQCNTLIPRDNSIPQQSEGDQVMSLSITPKAATNKLKIEVVANLTRVWGGWGVTAALFQDAQSNALAVGHSDVSAFGRLINVVFTHYMNAGTTLPTTFKVRVGTDAGVAYLNGNNTGGLFGGRFVSSITITEYQP